MSMKPTGFSTSVLSKTSVFCFANCPITKKRQTMLFSATLSYRVLELTYEFMNLPEFISVTPEEVTVDRIEQSLSHVGREDKFRLLLGMLNREEWVPCIDIRQYPRPGWNGSPKS